jgi:hypothetical protein
MLKGIRLADEYLAKPIIGVANTWIETMADLLRRYSEDNTLTHMPRTVLTGATLSSPRLPR